MGKEEDGGGGAGAGRTRTDGWTDRWTDDTKENCSCKLLAVLSWLSKSLGLREPRKLQLLSMA